MNGPLEWLLPFYGLLLVFYIPLWVYLRRSRRTAWARRRFCRGIAAILADCTENADCIPQIQMLYKRLAERYTSLDERFRSPVEMLEDLVVHMDTSAAKSFKEEMRVDPPTQLRKRLVAMLELMKLAQPFSALPAKQGNLLNTIRHAIETGNSGLAMTALGQLGDEVEVQEGNLRRQGQKTQVAFAISIVGVILTFFFGVVSFIQFFMRL